MKKNSLVCLSILFLLPCALHAHPQGGRATVGSAEMQIQGDLLKVLTSDRAIIEWQNFSIKSGETTHFVQPAATSAVLNRVKNGEASELLGKLQSNGQVFLVNPQGVIIGKDAVINTSALFLSTLDIADQQFLEGKEFLFSGNSNATIENSGMINCPEGAVVLIGKQLENHGIINAPEGSVALLSGKETLIKVGGKEALWVRVAAANKGKSQIVCDGNIQALATTTFQEKDALSVVKQSGRILLVAEGGSVDTSGKLEACEIEIGGKEATMTKQASLIASQSVRVVTDQMLNNEASIIVPSGSISLTSGTQLFQNGVMDVSGEKAGNIQITANRYMSGGSLKAEGGSGSISIFSDFIMETTSSLLSVQGDQGSIAVTVNNKGNYFSSGSYLAGSKNPEDKSGTIQISAGRIALAGACLDASGPNHGGTITLGGKGSADTILINSSSKIEANALSQGDGGKILVYADKETSFFGHASVCAGQEGGNGGFIEISGKEALALQGTTLAHAPKGLPGELLIDPKNLTIDAVNGVYPQYQLVDPNPTNGGRFGENMISLSTGNIVITALGDNANAGAVYVYNGLTGGLISSLVGSTTGTTSTGDRIGNGTIMALSGNGNFVVSSIFWNNGVPNAHVGAVTWGNGTTGFSGGLAVPIGTVNSLIGSTSADRVGLVVRSLGNGNYITGSLQWNNGAIIDAGFLAFGNGTLGGFGPTGTATGSITTANSLVGTASGDNMGDSSAILVLGNGNYLSRNFRWDNGAIVDAGAITFGNGTRGGFGPTGTATGSVTTANSLVGTTSNDQIGSVTLLTNNNYVSRARLWDNGAIVNAGAATFGNGTLGGFGPTGTATGSVTTANSLVGTTSNDNVAESSTVLPNGNYTIESSSWNNGAIIDAGAVTFGNGTLGGFGPLNTTGSVTSTNSLVGTTSGDRIGFGVSVALSNGNYVASTTQWHGGTGGNAGAVTFGNGTLGGFGPTGTATGSVSTANSLVGSSSGDLVGTPFSLGNGNYCVRSESWRNGAILSAGAVTFGNGTLGTFGPLGVTGTITAANSLVGTTSGDRIGSTNGTVAVLSNGNYVIGSGGWDNAALVNAGATTLGNGTLGGFGPTGIATGSITVANSLVGTTSGDLVGNTIQVLPINGNYFVRTAAWHNGGIISAGALTFGSGTLGGFGPGGTVTGSITVTNSLVGTTSGDALGDINLTLTNGNAVFGSTSWNNGAIVNAGATTFANGTLGGFGPTGTATGSITTANSLVGTTSSDQIGQQLTALSNGNYSTVSTSWDNGTIVDAGAATFGNGTKGGFGPFNTTGSVSVNNSLVGTSSEDAVGNSITILSNGNYLVQSSFWDNGSIVDTGALTFGSGTLGGFGPSGSAVGSVSSSNSLVGSTSNDFIGQSFPTVFSDGSFVATATQWDNGTLVDAGAATYGNGTTGTPVGTVSRINSLVGSVANSNLNLIIQDSVNREFLATFFFDTSGGVINAGVVRAGLTDPSQITYRRAEGNCQSMTIVPDYLLATLNTGTGLTVQAENDITINSPILISNPSGSGGNFKLTAGRNISLANNANITTDGGSLTLIANASDAPSTCRDPGSGSITFGDNITINSGSGDILMSVDAAGPNPGNIVFGNNDALRTTGSGSQVLSAPAPNSNITFGSNAFFQVQNGTILFSAGDSISCPTCITVDITGSGSISTHGKLVCCGFPPEPPSQRTLAKGFFAFERSIASLFSLWTANIYGGYLQQGPFGPLYTNTIGLLILPPLVSLDWVVETVEEKGHLRKKLRRGSSTEL
jgi:filamentous hemagglutinin family protein